MDRLILLGEREPAVRKLLKAALIRYHWFLEKTELSTDELEDYFLKRDNRTEAFTNARAFGDEIFRILMTTAEEKGTLRYLVV